MGSDWLAALPSANQKPGLEMCLNSMDFNMEKEEMQGPGQLDVLLVTPYNGMDLGQYCLMAQSHCQNISISKLNFWYSVVRIGEETYHGEN